MHSANADELTERTRGKNRNLIHDSMMARTPVSSGGRRFSEGSGSKPQVTGHRSRITGHRSWVMGHRSRVTGPKQLIFNIQFFILMMTLKQIKLANNFCPQASHLSGQRQVLT